MCGCVFGIIWGVSMIAIGQFNMINVVDHDGRLTRLNVVAGIYSFPMTIIFYLIYMAIKIWNSDKFQNYFGKEVGKLK